MRVTAERGSIPLALLASIVVAGLMTAVVATIVQSERTARFDRSYTGVIQGADTGVQQAHHQLNTGQLLLDIDERRSFSATHGDQEVEYEVTRLSEREYEVVSEGTTTDGTRRVVVANLREESQFFPGAFGDAFVGLQGTSTLVDSYRSDSTNCSTNTDLRECWGIKTDEDPDNDFGTKRGALGTNEDFNFTGNVIVNRAILYDWANNAAPDHSDDNWGGERCEGNPCEEGTVFFEDERLTFADDDDMAFIYQKLEMCDTDDPDQYKGDWKLGDESLAPFDDSAEANPVTPQHPKWSNFYCADTLEFNGNVTIDVPDNKSTETPVVIVVRDQVTVKQHLRINCPDCPSQPMNTKNRWRGSNHQLLPKSPRLQIYVATSPETQSADVTIEPHSAFAGVIYAPRAGCGSSVGPGQGGGGDGGQGGAGAHIYGSLICGTVSNPGNWHFHYDEVLGDMGAGTYTVASWSEEPQRELQGEEPEEE